ncbi:MAG: VIT and VWA domain-containing protein [Gemmatimonadota bacterium]|nr:VIT and VWA domain-containing protein [Gemmatimonadota bacterium]
MRTSMLALALLFALPAIPDRLPGQGIIVPRCGPIPDCRPPLPCLRCPTFDAAVVRTSSQVRVDLSDRVLRYEVEETFTNRGGRLGEADYIFPLPGGAAFQDLKLSINGELVAGETMSADRARQIYEDIVRRQRDPALVEWMGSGMLRTRIFPIGPGEEKRVVVRFQMIAPREGDALRVDYRRGAPPGSGRGEREGRTTFTLTYPAREGWGDPYSPTHALDVHDTEGHRRVEARGDGSEVTVLLPLRHTTTASVSVLTHADGPDDGFALITLAPPAALPRMTPRDVTFVLDVSGSMSGKKMDQARAAGRQLLHTLAPRDRFRMIDFSTDVRSFRDGFLPATPDNLRDAEKYLDELEATGSTNISGALAEALRPREEPGRMAVVLFVTDGEPTVGERRPDAIAQRAAELRGNRRLFTFGLGADVNVPLLEQLALQGRGTAHFVRPQEDVERAVSLVASRLTNPVVTDVRLVVEGVRLSKMLPAGAIDIFAGQDLVLLARYSGSGPAQLRVEGQSAAGPVSWSSSATFPERERGNPFIPRLWATQRIGWLSAEKRQASGSSELDQEIRELGERYGIPTEFSSYLVQEPAVIVDGRLPRPLGMGGMNGAAPSAPAARFEAAKIATAQRSAVTLSSGDSTMADALQRRRGDKSVGAVRRVGDRLFLMRDGVWTDSRLREGLRTIRVKAYSAAYFQLVQLLPELGPALALGERVVVAGRSIAVAVEPDGLELLAAGDVSSLRSEW